MSVYAISDLHGCLKVYEVLKKQILLPEDKVYVLGDCGDRGPEPWETIKAVMTDPQFVYIKGNHDDMLVKAAREAINGDGASKQRLLWHNGGYETLAQFLEEEKVEGWIEHIASRPTYIEYKNENGQDIFLCHAGVSHGIKEEFSYEDLIWDRDHYFDNSKLLDNTIVVHGHTPLYYIAEDLEIEVPNPLSALKYADGKKYCIDAGTFATGYSILLNLDTLQTILIDIND